MPKKYDVHVIHPTRFKFCGVEAESAVEAMEEAEERMARMPDEMPLPSCASTSHDLRVIARQEQESEEYLVDVKKPAEGSEFADENDEIIAEDDKESGWYDSEKRPWNCGEKTCGHEGISAKYRDLHNFLAGVAGMTKDGEGNFVLEIDDAVDTLHSIIDRARELTGFKPEFEDEDEEAE